MTADKNIQAVVDGVLGHRRRALGLADFTFETHVHPDRDPGCYHKVPVFLRGLLSESSTKGLLVFDQAWVGNPHRTALETEDFVRSDLHRLGLTADVVVIDPEIEVWVWSGSPRVDEVLGWGGANPPLREWLEDASLWSADAAKPGDPKAAVESALFEKRIPRSSSLYRELARKVSMRRCGDPSFDRFCSVLRRWFAVPARGGER